MLRASTFPIVLTISFCLVSASSASSQVSQMQSRQLQVQPPAPTPTKREHSASLELPSQRSRLTNDPGLSRKVTGYLHGHRLPYVSAQTLSDAAGKVSAVVLMGQVRTESGKQDAEAKVRDFLGLSPELALENQVEVRPETGSTHPTVSHPSSVAGRPPALEPQSGCELWRGTFSGNDPSVLVEARFCPNEQGGVTGLVQWSSLSSGYNVREVSGSREANGNLVLRDLRFRENRPKAAWHFCLIDKYSLAAEASDHLAGSYVPRACGDHARIDLRRVTAPVP